MIGGVLSKLTNLAKKIPSMGSGGGQENKQGKIIFNLILLMLYLKFSIFKDSDGNEQVKPK